MDLNKFANFYTKDPEMAKLMREIVERDNIFSRFSSRFDHLDPLPLVMPPGGAVTQVSGREQEPLTIEKMLQTVEDIEKDFSVMNFSSPWIVDRPPTRTEILAAMWGVPPDRLNAAQERREQSLRSKARGKAYYDELTS